MQQIERFTQTLDKMLREKGVQTYWPQNLRDLVVFGGDIEGLLVQAKFVQNNSGLLLLIMGGTANWNEAITERLILCFALWFV